MSEEVTITALRPFNRTAAGDICEPGDVFDASKSRAEELERLGLAKVGGTKAAPTPENKAAPAPANKGVTVTKKKA